ncbi:MAG: uridine kinase [Lentisphaerota bacterium]
MKKCIIIGIAGGTGSGKTSVSRNIVHALGSSRVAIMEQDSYYMDLAHIPLEERKKVNFDHPSAFDKGLLVSHLRSLMAGSAVEMPVYDYAQHTRSGDTVRLANHQIIIIEGILILEDPELRELMDIKLYVDTDPDVRFIRRLKRDVKERGRDLDAVIHQYETVVRPMHLQFVEPSKRYADMIIPGGGRNKVAIDLIKTKIQALLRDFEEIDKSNH